MLYELKSQILIYSYSNRVNNNIIALLLHLLAQSQAFPLHFLKEVDSIGIILIEEPRRSPAKPLHERPHLREKQRQQHYGLDVRLPAERQCYQREHDTNNCTIKTIRKDIRRNEIIVDRAVSQCIPSEVQ